LEAKAKKLNISTGARHMLVATFYFALMNIFIKTVTHLPVMEIVFFRCGISFLICFAEMKRTGISMRGSNYGLLFIRGAVGTSALYLYFITITHMSLGTAVIIQYLSPIFTTILALFILNEKVRPVTWFFFLISFSGVFVMKGLDTTIDVVFLTIGIASSILSAFAYITIRALKNKEHPMLVVLYFQLVGAVTGLIFSIPNFEMPHGMDWLYLVLIGIFTQLGQVNLTKSLQQENVAKVSIINYTGVVYAVAAGFFIFGEQYSSGTLLGMLLVIAGVVLSMFYR
jgi:drug/metabolite transporter (DMT)-like permease